MNRGKFITIEGVEGAGKSSALHFIQHYFSNLNLVLTREPGGTVIAEEIRQVLLHAGQAESMQAETELLLMFASRTQHIQQCIRPALENGSWILSDRYIDASYAYQGHGRGVSLAFIQLLDQFIVGDLYPDLTILMDVPPEIGMMRAEKRNAEKDRIENEKMDFFNRVREGYLERAAKDSDRIKIIDASLSIEKVQEQIKRVLNDFIAGIRS